MKNLFSQEKGKIKHLFFSPKKWGYPKFYMAFWLTILTFACDNENTLELSPDKKAPNLTFTKLVTNKSSLTTAGLLQQVKGEKANYTLKSITLSDSNFGTVEGTKPNFTLKLKKAGTFKINIVLERRGYEDAIISDAEIEYTTVKFIFDKLVTSKSLLTATELLQQIRGAKTGYTLKSVTLSDSSFGTVEGTKPNFTLRIAKAGTFKINIVLEKNGYEDVTITDAEIEYTTVKFIFDKLVTSKSLLTATELLQQIRGAKTGYTLKSVTLSDSSFGTVEGTRPNFTLRITKAGSFTATLVLEKLGVSDETITNAGFEIQKPTFTFNKLTRTISQGDRITTDQILAQIPNVIGYTLKSFVFSDVFHGTLTGTKPNIEVTLVQSGTITATIVLEKAGYLDVTITDATFEKETIFIFDGTTKTITGIEPSYKTLFNTLTTVIFPDKIDGKSVDNITGSTSSSSLENIFGGDQSNPTTNVKVVHLPKNLKTIGDNTFFECTGLTTITLPDSVTAIGDLSFGYCSKLTTINIPPLVTTITHKSFDWCTGLTTVTIPSTVTLIEAMAFYSCKNLVVKMEQTDPTKTTLKKTHTYSGGRTSSEDYPFAKTTERILVPNSSRAAYQGHPIWNQYTIVGY